MKHNKALRDLQNIQDKEQKKKSDFKSEIESMNKVINKLTQENIQKDIQVTTITRKNLLNLRFKYLS